MTDIDTDEGMLPRPSGLLAALLAPRDADADVHARLIALLADVHGMRRAGWNEQQSFAFRSIDQATAEARRLFAQHGLGFTPRYRPLDDSTYTTKTGTLMRRVMVEGRYRIFAADGTSVTTTSLGEGVDVLDKATSKAQTMALKTMLLQLLLISDPDDDADGQSPEPGHVEQARQTSGPPRQTRPRKAPAKVALAPEIEAALAPLNGINSATMRTVAKTAFVARFGPPDKVKADRAGEVENWVDGYLNDLARAGTGNNDDSGY